MQTSTQQVLERAILATVAYFDVLGIAVTPFELWRYLINPLRLRSGQARVELPPNAVDLNLVYDLLGQSFLKERLGITRGFVHLKGSSSTGSERILRTKIKDEKLKIIIRIIRKIRWVPFLRAVFLSGSVAVGHPVKKSDLDLLIVTGEGRIWLCRTLVTLATFLMGAKRRGALTRDRACLNHYFTENHLTIPQPSLYNAFTYAHLVPLWEAKPLIDKFYAANPWLNDYILSPGADPIFHWQLKDIGISRFVRLTLERQLGGRLGDILERFLGWLESRRIERDPRTHAPGGRVKVSSHALEFHPNSPELLVLERYNKLASQLIRPSILEKDSGLIKS